jgi:class 3 adenylate cyclase/tetratricopeptide (TPR) repeat protein
MCSAGASVPIMDLGAWLRSLGLERYETIFRENAIDADVLHDLTEDHLREIGLPLGARLKLLKAISALASGAEPIGLTPDVVFAGPTADTAERRQVTVMFSDLVGSTALADRMDPEDLREIISAYQKCAAETVQRYDGFVARYMGDGVLVHFGYPRAHEDDAERAVRAGLELVTAVAALKPRALLQTRIGIATGIVVVGELIGSRDAQERAIVGKTPNLAARLQGIAKANMVVICDSTRRLLGNLFELEDLGPRDLKGITDPTRAWAALRASSMESRFEAMHASGLTALVGREEEFELLLRRWSRTKSGEGQVVLLSGEAGIGNTAAMLEPLASEPHTRLRYFCSPQRTDSALYPVIGQLERAAGLTPEDTPQAKLDKLDAVLAQSSASAQDAAFIAEMLSLQNDGRYPVLDLTPQQRRQKTLEALTAQLEALTRQRPVLQIFEDAHWADPTTLEVFGRAVDRIRTLRVLLIVTFRPEFEPPWIGQPHVTMLTINRLTEREVGAIIDRIVGNKRLPASIRQDIIERTDGIPLFVEEMTKAVLEVQNEHAVERAAAAVPSPALAVPASLHASLMARLDRLGAAKEVAQIGAVIGREFSHALLAAVVHQSEAQLGSALNRLMAAGLLFRQGVPPHASYLFKHALVRDTAYGTLLREPRRALHARIADTLESQFAEIAEHQPELLAQHAEAAGLTEKALDYWEQAGQKALARPAYKETIASLENAIRLCRVMGSGGQWLRREQTIYLQLSQALIANQGFQAPATLRAFERALALADEIGDVSLLLPALYGRWVNYYTTGKDTAEVAERYTVLAETQSETGPRLVGLRMLGLERFHEGRFKESLALVTKALDGYDPVEHQDLVHRFGHDPRAASANYKAWNLWHLGFADQAAQLSQDNLNWIREVRHANTTGQMLFYGAMTNIWLRRPDQVEAAAREALRHAEEVSLAIWHAWALIHLGWAFSQQNAARGLDEIEAGLREAKQIGACQFEPFHLGLAADAYSRAGRHNEARTSISKAFVAMANVPDLAFAAELHRTRAALALRSGAGRNDAAEDLRRALEIARRQQALSLQLRAAHNLAELFNERGERQQATDLLAPVYGEFTEGFDTPDLKEAKVLLDELLA